jgi:chemotaxis protein methyltransferase CheR
VTYFTPNPQTGSRVPVPVLDRLVDLVRGETGNTIARARYGFLEEIALRRAKACGAATVDDYVDQLAADAYEDEWERLVPLVTIKESYFFRAPQQFAAMERHVLPELVARRSAERRLTIWSAASARGEEPATLAIILAEHAALATWDWRVVATDVDDDALAGARRGLYGERAVSQVPPRLLERWFTKKGHLYELDESLRKKIDYRPLNLSRPPYRTLGEPSFDLVLLRNVLIYFRRPLQRRVIAEVASCLAPDGFLFLGASETLWQISDRLAAVDMHDCFAYRHPEAVADSTRPARRVRLDQLPALGQPVAKTKAPEPEPLEPPPEPSLRPRTAPLPADVEALEARQVAEAVAGEPTVADEVETDHPADPSRASSAQDLLMEAARRLVGNDLDAVAPLVEDAREGDASEPAAYALEGFLADLTDRSEDAVGAYRAALYLDPDLYQVRQLLADCLFRLGHLRQAEHQFRETLASLQADRGRELVVLEELPLPSRERVVRRCRQVLGGR